VRSCSERDNKGERVSLGFIWVEDGPLADFCESSGSFKAGTCLDYLSDC
jgi:hypothetical protein